MTFEIGKKYKDGDGLIYKIVSIYDKEGLSYPIRAVIAEGECTGIEKTFTMEGHYYEGNKAPLKSLIPVEIDTEVTPLTVNEKFTTEELDLPIHSPIKQNIRDVHKYDYVLAFYRSFDCLPRSQRKAALAYLCALENE